MNYKNKQTDEPMPRQTVARKPCHRQLETAMRLNLCHFTTAGSFHVSASWLECHLLFGSFPGLMKSYLVLCWVETLDTYDHLEGFLQVRFTSICLAINYLLILYRRALWDL